MTVCRILDATELDTRTTAAKKLAVDWINLGFRDDNDVTKLGIIRECLADAGLLAAVLYEIYGEDRYALQSLLLNVQARGAQ